MLGSSQFLKPFLRPSLQMSMALALRWHHTLTWACVNNRPVGPWHFLFVLQLSLCSSLIAHHCCLEKKLVLSVRNPVSRGMAVSAPQVIEEGVSLVDLWGVVWYVQRTCGNSSTHFPFASSSLFLSPLTMTLLTVSAYPFPYGYVGVEYLFVMSRLQQYLLKALLSD